MNRMSALSIFVLFCLAGAAAAGGTGGCGAAATGGGGNNSDCVAGDSDFYVVENADCEDDAGKLSRINPDVPCKEVILSNLDCPVDFVMGSNGIGYLSERTNNSAEAVEGAGGVGAGESQPGNIYEVDVSGKAKTLMNEVTGRSFVSPAGLALMEDLSQDERDAFCGGNTVVQMALLIADEGLDTQEADADGGTVWIWCVNTDDFSESLTPIAVLSAGSDQMENPRGVAVLSRSFSDPNETTLIVTADSVDDTSGVVVRKAITSNDAAEVVSTGSFTTSLKDITIDGSDRPVLADAGGDGMVALLRLDEGEFDFISDFDGPQDILPLGTMYLVTEYGAGRVVMVTDIDDAAADADPINLTEGLTLDGPDGISR